MYPNPTFKNLKNLLPSMVEHIPLDLASELMGPLIETIQPLILKISLLVGGIFGLYLLLIIIRVHYERKKVKLLEDIRYDLDQLNIHKGIKHSIHKKGTFKKTIQFIKNGFKR